MQGVVQPVLADLALECGPAAGVRRRADLPLKRDWGRLRGTAPWAYEVLRSVHGRGPTREEKASWFAAAGFRTPAEARP